MHSITLPIITRLDFARWRRLEGIAIWRFYHILGLGIYGAQYETFNRLVVLSQPLILRQLIRGISQPFGVDVASHDEALRPLPCVFTTTAEEVCFLALFLRPVYVPFDCCIQGVWKCILEESEQIPIYHTLVQIANSFLH
jgi:hypothetical protein